MLEDMSERILKESGKTLEDMPARISKDMAPRIV